MRLNISHREKSNYNKSSFILITTNRIPSFPSVPKTKIIEYYSRKYDLEHIHTDTQIHVFLTLSFLFLFRVYKKKKDRPEKELGIHLFKVYLSILVQI